MRRLKDVDAAQRAFVIKTIAWAAFPSLPVYVGGFYYGLGKGLPLVVAALGALVSGAVVNAVLALPAIIFANRVEAAAHWMTNRSGNIPAKRDYSYATSLMIRGKYEEAAAAYEHSTVEFPDDPEPCLLLARLYRDRLDRTEDAAAWFQRTLAIEGVKPEAEIVAVRELVELYTHKLRKPTKALPLLARTAEKHAGNPHGQWAGAELERLQERLRQAAAEELGRA